MPRTVVVNEQPQQSDILSQYLGNLGLPALIVSTIFPGVIAKIAKYPRLTRLVTIPLVLWIASNFLVGKLLGLWRNIMSNAMSSVIISSDDFYLYTAFKGWLAKRRMLMLEKSISAQSVFYLRNKGQDGRTIEKELSNNKSIVFDPQNRFQIFYHRRRLFLLTMDTKLMIHTATDKTEMKIWCLGLSPKPIENLLLDVYDSSRTQESRILTTIMTPQGGRSWNRRCTKPARPLSSVYLDHSEKDRLEADLKEYLAPTTAKWYQDRGIPYRRGYLFHGSPGTGKSSLALALAGHFRLDVYIVSLLDLEISDSSLLQLFQAVRSGVLVLLEDVDSAGLGREVQEPSEVPTSRIPMVEKKKAQLQTSRITLSGLLNAIDGAGAPEGHIVVMTTNAPDELDEALVRPGRIDVKIQFTKAIRSQIKDIFVNMYQPASAFEPSKQKVKSKKQEEAGKPQEQEEGKSQEREEEKARGEKERKEEVLKLQQMAEEFADSVPEETFSPAQLQDFILLRKDQPQRAVEEISGWVAKELSTALSSSSASKLPLNTQQSPDTKSQQEEKPMEVKEAADKEEVIGKPSDQQPDSKAEKKPQDEQQAKETPALEVKTTEKESNPNEPGPTSPSDSNAPSGSASEKGSEDDETSASSVGSEEEVKASDQADWKEASKNLAGKKEVVA